MATVDWTKVRSEAVDLEAQESVSVDWDRLLALPLSEKKKQPEWIRLELARRLREQSAAHFAAAEAHQQRLNELAADARSRLGL